MYIYQRSGWPEFTWDSELINPILLPLKFKQGQLLGKMKQLGFPLQDQASLEMLTSEIIKSTEIEGEHLDRGEVRSSVARHLGLNIGGLLPSDRHVDGIVEMLLDATQHFNNALTIERLCDWHALLFPTGLSGLMLVNPGVFRRDNEGPMQVVSGSYGREKVHFQAPPASVLQKEVKLFLKWFNTENPALDPLLKASIAHLWFVTLHPFDDGNGRMARAVTDLLLARSENLSERFYSMSAQIRKERSAYYDILEKTQKGSLNITAWLVWFLNCLSNAIEDSDQALQFILNKAKFWDQHATLALNPRQIKMLNLLFDGFKGALSSSKWAKMMKCSQDTATRDINQLIEFGILVKSESSGRSTNYLLKQFPIHQIGGF